MSTYSLQEKFYLYKVRFNKDAEAFGHLYDLYIDKIFRFIFFKVSSREQAEDLTSEVFLKTWEYLTKPDVKVDNFNALIYRIARNAVIDYYRARRQDYLDEDEEVMESIQDARSLETDLNTQLEFETVEKHLAKLKDAYREVLLLKYIEELSVGEIAKIIGKSSANVRVLIHRATNALKELAGENHE